MAKTTCESTKRLTMSFLKNEGYLHGGLASGTVRWSRAGEDTGSVGIRVNATDMNLRVNCTYTNHYSGEKADLDYAILLTTTPCHFGGVRYWFICPLSVNGIGCNRRVGVLYLDGKYFGCRRCYGLAYASQQGYTPARLSYFGEFLRLESKIEEQERRIRVRYWKGKPTKRYKRLLNDYEKLSRATDGLAGQSHDDILGLSTQKR